jgi:hypothetical protein
MKEQGLQPIRRSIEKLGPYQSLALLAVPACLVEPLKLIAVFVAGEGHWITGTVMGKRAEANPTNGADPGMSIDLATSQMVTVAYAASLLVVERLFGTVKPKLLQLRWFAKLWSWFVIYRYRVARVFRRA